MIKSKKQMFIIIGVFCLTLLLGTVTYAFFNYTRTGSANIIKTGRIAFNTSQDGSINLTNAFPINSQEAQTDTTNAKSVSIAVTGDTDYANGLEYLVTASEVNLTVGSGANAKTLPIALEISVSDNVHGEEPNQTTTTLGTAETGDYYANRSSYTVSKYKVLYDGELEEDTRLLVGYIAPNTIAGTPSGIDGTINIKAYIDSSKILISDTYPSGDVDTNNDNITDYTNGTPASMAEGKVVFTITEWNSIQGSPLSFKVKVEANEGLWVKQATNMTLASTSGMVAPGGSETLAITTNGTGEITCQSSDTNIVTCSVNSNTLTINGVALGDATITVNQGEGALTSTASTTYTIVGPICKRVTELAQLHSETCSQSSNFCAEDGYTGDNTTITYGNAVALNTNTLTLGDAFDCKVSSTGGYTERFYYVSPYYDTVNETFDNEYATLIYYSNTVNGVASGNGSAYNSNDRNYEGPVTALANLPTRSQWNNIELKTESRKIWACTNANCDTKSLTTQNGNKTITPNPFTYTNSTTRLLTINELKESGCDTLSNKTGFNLTGSLKACNFLFEGTKYANNTNILSTLWLENPRAVDSYGVWFAYAYTRRVDYDTANYTYGVRPTIDVPIDRLLK